MEDPPAERLVRYRSNKKVWAGEIVRVAEDGCEVRNADGTTAFRHYQPEMACRYQPQRGDYWTIYDDGWVMIWPAWAFSATSGGFEPI